MTKKNNSESSDPEDQLMKPFPLQIDSWQQIYMMQSSNQLDQLSNLNEQISLEKPVFQNKSTPKQSLTSQIIDPLYISFGNQKHQCHKNYPILENYQKFKSPTKKYQVKQGKNVQEKIVINQQYIFKDEQMQQKLAFKTRKPHQEKMIKIQMDKVEIKKKKQSKFNKSGSKRKKRSTITQQKLKNLLSLLKCYNEKIQYEGLNIRTLKEIAKMLQIGYSTVLHKYKQFHETGTIKEGVLIKFKNVKRSYKKSLIIRGYIINAMKSKKFSSNQQLADFISDNYRCKVSRTIVNRKLHQIKQIEEHQKKRK